LNKETIGKSDKKREALTPPVWEYRSRIGNAEKDDDSR
jgi:hypothetical protein